MRVYWRWKKNLNKQFFKRANRYQTIILYNKIYITADISRWKEYCLSHTSPHYALLSPRQSLKMITIKICLCDDPGFATSTNSCCRFERHRNICILKNLFCIVALTVLEGVLYKFKGTSAVICIHINPEIRYGGKSLKGSSDRGTRSAGSVSKLPSPFSVFSVIQKIQNNRKEQIE